MKRYTLLSEDFYNNLFNFLNNEKHLNISYNCLNKLKCEEEKDLTMRIYRYYKILEDFLKEYSKDDYEDLTKEIVNRFIKDEKKELDSFFKVSEVFDITMKFSNHIKSSYLITKLNNCLEKLTRAGKAEKFTIIEKDKIKDETETELNIQLTIFFDNRKVDTTLFILGIQSVMADSYTQKDKNVRYINIIDETGIPMSFVKA